MKNVKVNQMFEQGFNLDCGNDMNMSSVETIPQGGFRGGEDIPAGGWRGGEDIPAGGWRGGEDIPSGGWRGGEDIPKGGWRNYLTTDVYRTQDGEAFFEFGFFDNGSNLEIDILNMPSYGSRDEDLHSTHRLPSDRGGHKVCFGDDSIVGTDNGKYWAAAWAEHTWNYIKTGEEFPNS